MREQRERPTPREIADLSVVNRQKGKLTTHTGSLGVEEIDEGKENDIGDEEDQESVSIDGGLHGR